MSRVQFRLTMPVAPTWNGKWSIADKNFSVVRELTADQIARIFGEGASRSWTHRWSDGWVACVTARGVPSGEELPKSDGFNGYDWMIDDIVSRSEIREAQS